MSETNPPHVLVVDDDRRIRELIQSYLSANGLRVSAAGSAAEARQRMLGIAFDLAVVDVMMPDESGLELTRKLRAENSEMPILILSALADPEDRIRGLTAGSDDYLSKPFDPRELLLRIRSILKRKPQRPTVAEEVRFGRCRFNLARGELRRGEELVRLSSRERDMLRLLAQRAGHAVPRGELAVGGSEENARSVDVQINRLRRKIEDDPAVPVYLQTVRGAGYILHID
jgi:two-component system, OmpR family, phosphate regulon response regulator OmpR